MTADTTTFKQTELGPLPPDWEVVRLGDGSKSRKRVFISVEND